MDENISKYKGELIEPDKVGFSFDAPGWKWLFMAILLLLIIIVVVQIRKYIKNAYRREAIKKVNEIASLEDVSEVIYQLVYQLKIVAMNVYGRNPIANLSEMEWINYLNKRQYVNLFDQENTSLIFRKLYNKDETVSKNELNAFITQIKVWIKKHKV